MLGELEALLLVVGADALAITLRRRIGQALEHQTADDLAMFQDEGNFTGAHFQYGARARRLPRLEAETPESSTA